MLKEFKNILKRLNNLRNPKLKQNCENCRYLVYEGDNVKMVPTCQYKGCYITNPYFNGEKCKYFLGRVI